MPPTETATRPAFRAFDVVVRRVVRLSPSFVRVTFTGAELNDFAPLCLDRRIKLAFPAATGASGVFPAGEDWFAAWRGMPETSRPILRTYTAGAVRPQVRELDVDFVVHGDEGIATSWVRRARPGDPLVVIGPDAHGHDPRIGIEWRPSGAPTVLLAGDETAVPAIVNILSSLDDDIRGLAVLEVPARDDIRSVSAPAGVRVRWLPREGAAVGELLTEAVRSEVSDEPVDAWLAGEQSVVQQLRRLLVREAGIHRDQVAFMGYWRAGRSSAG